MPLYTIKHLKAPWPAGAVVGDVIEFEVLPGWAAGKCELGGARATLETPEAPAPRVAAYEMTTDGRFQSNIAAGNIHASLAAAEAQARQEREAIHQKALGDAEDRLKAAEQALAAAKVDLEASLSREATLQGHLTDTQKLNEAAAGELEKVRGQVADLQAQLTAAKSETKATKK